jgi:hypothetical protein
MQATASLVRTNLVVVTLGVILGLPACTSRSGLSISDRDGAVTPTGGSVLQTGGTVGGTGGATAAAGGDTASAGGSISGVGGSPPATGGRIASNGGSTSIPDAGGKRDVGPDVLCGVTSLCDLYCAYGYQIDANGCSLCRCNPGPDASAGKDTGPNVCGPVCALYCPYGNEIDVNGCPLCKCKSGPDASVVPDLALLDSKARDTATPVDGSICPAVCDIYCPYGNVLDKSGCATCVCNPDPSKCPAIKCKACTFGYLKDSAGCDTCNCASDPGTPCGQFTDYALCNATGGRCQWLAPGCGSPSLSTSGCFDQTLLNCDGTCPNGLTCLKRSVDACPLPNACGSCGKTMALCM